ncbi:hypothetical protein MOUN0_N08724 [Monosporozyma unispora]|nr:hypothetical protein C6P44_000948 [Kazachstania unispora]
MSDFWDKNKGSIKSGLLTAGKYGYQGTKYVAKTGYQVGKSQYQANKKNRKNGGSKAKGNDNDEEIEKGEPTPINRLNDPHNFPAPPLRQGQMQYAGNGQYVSAENTPIANTPPAMQTPNQQMNQYQNQNQPQQGYFNQQYSSPGTPGTPGAPGTPQQYPMQQPMQQQPMQQQGYQQQQQQQQPMQQQGYQQQQQPMQQQGYQQQQQQPMQQQGYQQPSAQVNQQQQQQQGFMQELSQQFPSQSGPQTAVVQQPVQQQGFQQQQPLQPGQQPIAQQGFQQQQLMQQQPIQQQPMLQQPRQQPAVPGRPQPQIPGQQNPTGPPIPFRTQTNMSGMLNQSTSESMSPTPPSVGPHFEVKPFNKEEYEEAKKHRAVVLPEIDPGILAPPPTHKDRSSNESSTRNSPSVKPSNPHVASNSSLPRRGMPTPPGSSPSTNPVTTNDATPLVTTPGKDVDQQEKSQETEAESKAAVLGSYHEPTTSYAPPPKPHRNVETNRNTSRQSSYSHTPPVNTNNTLPTRGNQPPPVLPKRSTNASLESSGSNVTPAQPSNEHDQGGNGTNEETYNNSITGSYSEHTVNFQPPPKPFRRPGEGPENRILSKTSSSNSFSSQSVPGLPTRRHTTDYPAQSGNSNADVNDERPTPLTPSTQQPHQQPISEFLPPPKPFRSRTEELPNRSTNDTYDSERLEVKGRPRDEFVDCNDEMPPQLPPHPDVSNSFDYNEPKDALSGRAYPSSQSIASSIPSSGSNNNDFIQDLNASISTLSLQGSRKSKGTPPPAVKPKPKSLSHVSLGSRSASSASLDSSKKHKKPPPVIKPKPKNIGDMLHGHESSSSVSLNKSKMEMPTKSSEMSPPQHPSRGSSRTEIPSRRAKPPVPTTHSNIQIPTNRRNKMPLPHEIDNNPESSTNHGDDVNPFSIYKKDAVPSSSDRMHDNN